MKLIKNIPTYLLFVFFIIISYTGVYATIPNPSDISPLNGAYITDPTPVITFNTDVTATCRMSLSDESYEDMADDIICEPLIEDLVAYYKFDEEEDEITTLADSSGNGYTGVANGTIPAIGKIGGSRYFNDISDYAYVDSLDLLNAHNSGEVSYTIWFYHNAYDHTRLFFRGTANTYEEGRGCQYEPEISKNKVALSGCNESGLVSTYSPSYGWNHLVASFSETNDTAEVYLNGELVGSKTISEIKSASSRASYIFNAESWATRLSFGAAYDPASSTYMYFALGELDEIRVYNRPLSSEEVEILYNYDTSEELKEQWCLIPDLGSNGSKSLYISCSDGAGNDDTSETNENLSYTFSDTNPPEKTNFLPLPGSTIIDQTPIITFITSEEATCRLSFNDEGYDSMSDDVLCEGSETRSHTCESESLGIDGYKNLYIACIDPRGNKDTIGSNYKLTLKYTGAPTITLSELSPDPYPMSVPFIRGTAESVDDAKIFSIQYQLDGVDSNWRNCIAIDGSFHETEESFYCQVGLPSGLENGLYTVYLRGISETGHITIPGDEVSLTFEIDTSLAIGIYTIEDLDGVRNDLEASYILMNDLDFNDCNSYEDCGNMESYTTGEGWIPIGTFDPIEFDFIAFEGIFNGQGNTISNLYVNNDGFPSLAGLFAINSGLIENLGLESVNIYIPGTGLQGAAGGLVALDNGGILLNSYTTGNVSNDVLSEESLTGGLLGYSPVGSMVINTYSTCSVDGYLMVGGLVGGIEYGTISNSYSTGSVNGIINPGGLVGLNYSTTITNSFWDTETSGQVISDGGTGKTTSEMKTLSTFNDTNTEGLDEAWDILGINTFNPSDPSIWYIDSGNDYPKLFWEYIQPQVTTLVPTTITINSAKLNGNLTQVGTLGTVKVYFQYRPTGGTWINTSKVTRTTTGTFNYNLTSLNPNSDYEYRSGLEYGNSFTIYGLTIPFKTLPVVIPKVIITNIGLITNVPDKDSIFFYFTSTNPKIKGVAYPNTTVKFTTNNQSFTTQADSEGKFNISLTLPRGRSVIEYYAYDPYGDQSPTRTLTLVVGTENFPTSLLERLGLVTPTEEERDTPIEDLIKDDTQPEKEDVEKKPVSNIQLLQFLDKDGNPMVGALVKIDGVEYYTDSKGEIRVVGLEEGKKYKAKIEYNGEKYETEVLGEESTDGSIKVSITEEDILDTDWKKILIYGGMGFVVLIILIYILRKRDSTGGV